MEGFWILAIVILVVLAILCGIMIYLKFFKRTTSSERIARRTRKLQDKEAKLDEKLELLEIKKEVEESIADTQEKITKLTKLKDK